ncbi:hypothetical protein [Paraflavitalea pollutisoli]|uniref:hypothetical protein n=1 Tax=Paraflavitalea pollutisoli TaxID=3034143 RepID=UPI0023EC9CD7|nr:hypothetical protein [Paraflavitalea sp. H1-2-19X]
MSKTKQFTAPIYLLVPLILVQAFAIYFFVTMASTSLASERAYEQEHAAELDRYPGPQTSHRFVRGAVWAGITVVVLIAESILLWRLRKKRYNRFLAAGYILPLAFVLVFLPIVAIRMNILFDWLVPNPLLYWTGIGIAHVFLMVMICQAQRKKRPTTIDPANILDEFAEHS